MSLDTRFLVNKLIEEYGQDITIKKRSLSIDQDKYVTGESYSTVTAIGWVIPTSGLSEAWMLSGRLVDADYSIVLKSTTDVSLKDIIVLPDNIEAEVVDIVKHYELNHVAFIEAIVRKISSGE